VRVRDDFAVVRTAEAFRAVIHRWYSAERDWPAVVRHDRHGEDVAAGASAGTD